LNWAKAITGQSQGNLTIRTVRAVMTLLTYCNEENRTNRVVTLLLARNSYDPIQTSHGNRLDITVLTIHYKKKY
jgi:hypothetical protein